MFTIIKFIYQEVREGVSVIFKVLQQRCLLFCSHQRKKEGRRGKRRSLQRPKLQPLQMACQRKKCPRIRWVIGPSYRFPIRILYNISRLTFCVIFQVNCDMTKTQNIREFKIQSFQILNFICIQLEEHIVRLREELDREREERNYFQLERDKVNTFWEITKRQLEEKKAELRNKDREMEDAEERHQMEIKVIVNQ